MTAGKGTVAGAAGAGGVAGAPVVVVATMGESDLEGEKNS